jgi:hypothetical protein
MEFLLLSFISTLFLALEFLPYFYSLFITPKGFISLGVTHYAYDYFYYLSHMAQAEGHILFSTNLHTSEPQAYTYIGWVYVLFGKLFSLFGIFQTVGYQLASFFMMILLLSVLYFFLRSVFPDSWKKRVGALGLFLFSNALITIQNGHLTFFDTWNNFGSPFIRLEMVPHHLLTQTLLIASLFLIFSRRFYLISILFLSLFLSSLQPLQWMLMGASVGIISFLLKPSFKSLFPGILWILAGLPSVITLRALFQTQPYINTMTWEATQQQIYSLIDYLKFNGPVAILGVIGLSTLLFKVHSKSLTLLLFYSFLSLVLFFSPIPQYVSLLNVRFLSSLPTLLFAIATIELLSHKRFNLAWLNRIWLKIMGGDRKIELKRDPNDRLRTCDMNTSIIGVEKKVTPRIDQWEKRSTGPILTFTIAILIIIFLAPPLFFQMKQRLDYDVNNAYFFLSKGAYDALVYAPKVSTMDDVFLVQWPFSVSFTGLSGRREYNSNFLATIDIQEKEPKARAFFEGKMTEDEMIEFLKANRITRIIAYPWTFPSVPSFFKELYKTDILAIYSFNE